MKMNFFHTMETSTLEQYHSNKILFLRNYWLIYRFIVSMSLVTNSNSVNLGLLSGMFINYFKFFIDKNDIIFNKNIDINLHENLINNFDIIFGKLEVFHIFCDKYLMKGYMNIIYLVAKISLKNICVKSFAVFYNNYYVDTIEICFTASLLSQINKPKTVSEPKIVFDISIYKVYLKFFPHISITYFYLVQFLYTVSHQPLSYWFIITYIFSFIISMKSNLCTKTINFLSHE